MSPTKHDNVLSWASDIDDKTLEQAQRTARLPFVEGHLALMPDAHWGMGATVGSVIPLFHEKKTTRRFRQAIPQVLSGAIISSGLAYTAFSSGEPVLGGGFVLLGLLTIAVGVGLSRR